MELISSFIELIKPVLEFIAIIATIFSPYLAWKIYKLSQEKTDLSEENARLKDILKSEELCNFKNEKPGIINKISWHCSLLKELSEVDLKFTQDVREILIDLKQRFSCIFSSEEVSIIEEALDYLKSPNISPDKLLEYLQTISSNLKKERIFDYEYHKLKS